MKTLFASFLGLLLLVGCAVNPPAKVLTALDSGREIKVQRGQMFIIELPGNRTTGYSWSDRSEGNPVIQLVGTPGYRVDTARTGIAGVGGTETWQFRAAQTGQQTLRLDYVRPWEKNVAPARTVSFNVVVE